MRFKNIYYHMLHKSPEQITIYIYDSAINACKEEDAKKAGEAIKELINALNFDNKNTKELALKIFNLLKYCLISISLDNVNTYNFDEAEEILTGMRESIFHTDLKEDNNE